MRRQTARRKTVQHKADFRKRKEHDDRRNATLRTQVFDHYGWSCACCGSADRPSIDHIDGKGRQHRIELFGTHNASGARFWRWLITSGFPEGFQTLCGRCNRIKGATDSCPLHHGLSPLLAGQAVQWSVGPPRLAASARTPESCKLHVSR
jgi:5-methylcytosine-specific restriction endonuclease McrA